METKNSSLCSDELDLGFNLLYLTVPIVIFIVIKSSLLVVTLIWNSSLHNKFNVYVSSMTVADLLLGIVYSCFGHFEDDISELDASEQRLINSFLFGHFHSAITVYIIHIGVLSLDRYILIAHPFYYMKHNSKRCTGIGLSFIWIVGLIFILSPMIVYRDDKYHQRCILIHPPATYYLTTTSIYLFSSVTILICYFRIASLAFKHKIEANARRLHNSDNNGNLILKHNLTAILRSVKFFALMFGVFLLCTLPPVVIAGLNSFSTLPKYYLFISILVPINPLLRSIIYYKMNKKFRKVMAKTFCDLAALLFNRIDVNRQ